MKKLFQSIIISIKHEWQFVIGTCFIIASWFIGNIKLERENSFFSKYQEVLSAFRHEEIVLAQSDIARFLIELHEHQFENINDFNGNRFIMLLKYGTAMSNYRSAMHDLRLDYSDSTHNYLNMYQIKKLLRINETQNYDLLKLYVDSIGLSFSINNPWEEQIMPVSNAYANKNEHLKKYSKYKYFQLLLNIIGIIFLSINKYSNYLRKQGSSKIEEKDIKRIAHIISEQLKRKK